ncbi:MAG TPA: archaemetzincin [Terriglobales bacterium]|nr:archaemetzincin [Terriglobales bacterium]
MNAISLIRVNASRAAPRQGIDLVRVEELDELAAGLAGIFHVSCRVEPDQVEGEVAYDATRGQYYSTALLLQLATRNPDNNRHLVGISGVDLYVPILTFVFGEAQLAGNCAIVSLYRLREEFYGLPPSPELEQERLLKVTVHELGHTLGLRHCTDWRCVMASTHSAERMDIKSAEFCSICKRRARLNETFLGETLQPPKTRYGL